MSWTTAPTSMKYTKPGWTWSVGSPKIRPREGITSHQLQYLCIIGIALSTGIPGVLPTLLVTGLRVEYLAAWFGLNEGKLTARYVNSPRTYLPAH